MDGSSWFKQAAASARSFALRPWMVVLGAMVGGLMACVGPISDFPFSDDDEAPAGPDNGDGDSSGAPGDGDDGLPSLEPEMDAGPDSGSTHTSLDDAGLDDAGLDDAGLDDAGCAERDGGIAEDGGMPPCAQGDAS